MQKMQDPSLYSQINTQPQPQFPEQEHLKCPRCDSPNTKFCYYNNYNLSQPRHFCKSCKRYWTKGGALRNIPIGGASRKSTKRTSNKKTPTGSVVVAGGNKSDDDHGTSKVNGSGEGEGEGQRVETLPLMGENFGGQFGDLSGSFTSLLDSGEGQFGNFLDGLGQNLDPGMGQDVGAQVGLESGSSSNGDGFLNIHQW